MLLAQSVVEKLVIVLMTVAWNHTAYLSSGRELGSRGLSAPALDLVYRLCRKLPQNREIALVELAGLITKHAKSSQPKPAGRYNRNSCVAPDSILGHEWIFHRDGMGQGVFNDERFSAEDGIRAKRHFNRGTAGRCEPPIKPVRGSKELGFVGARC